MEQIIGLEIDWECMSCSSKTTTHIPLIQEGIRINAPGKCACGKEKQHIVTGLRESIYTKKEEK